MDFIESHHKTLTVGDGDLSFSFSLLNIFPMMNLTATTYDTLETLLM